MRDASTARTGWNDPDSAQTYDREMVPVVGGPMARGLLAAVPPESGPVLEVACGTGYFSGWLLQALPAGARVLGCDAGRAVLAVAAAKRLPGLSLVEADAHQLPVRDGAFAAAYCNLGMQIFLEPARVVAELARALRSGGGLAYAIPGRGTLIEFWRAFAERARQPDLAALIDDDGWRTIEHWTQPDDAAEIALHLPRLEAAGLAGARVELRTERLLFPSAGDLLSRGGFGHFNFAVETIPDEARRQPILRELARTLDAGRGPDGVAVTIRALIASGWKR